VSGIFLPLTVNSLPLATIYEVKIPLRKWKKSLLQRNPTQMTWHINKQKILKHADRRGLTIKSSAACAPATPASPTSSGSILAGNLKSDFF
jgi:hypothetical protein